jgi:hypothetical protein
MKTFIRACSDRVYAGPPRPLELPEDYAPIIEPMAAHWVLVLVLLGGGLILGQAVRSFDDPPAAPAKARR